jgi:hypothetical protein
MSPGLDRWTKGRLGAAGCRRLIRRAAWLLASGLSARRGLPAGRWAANPAGPIRARACSPPFGADDSSRDATCSSTVPRICFGPARSVTYRQVGRPGHPVVLGSVSPTARPAEQQHRPECRTPRERERSHDDRGQEHSTGDSWEERPGCARRTPPALSARGIKRKSEARWTRPLTRWDTRRGPPHISAGALRGEGRGAPAAVIKRAAPRSHSKNG